MKKNRIRLQSEIAKENPRKAWRLDIARMSMRDGPNAYLDRKYTYGHKKGSWQSHLMDQECIQHMLGRDRLGYDLPRPRAAKERGLRRKWRRHAHEMDKIHKLLIAQAEKLAKFILEEDQPDHTPEEMAEYVKWVRDEGVKARAVFGSLNCLSFVDYDRFGHCGRSAVEVEWRYLDEGTPSTRKCAYGVCDTPEQVLNHPALKRPGVVVHFTHIEKEPENKGKGGGWRWHKWGPYIGTGKPEHEYLDDEPGFEGGVHLFHIYRLW